jgi:hypothetical protein
MALEITSLRVDERITPGGNLWYADVPYLIVNATFRITEDEHLFERTKAEASEYSSVLTIDDPKRYEEFLLNWDLNINSKYDGYGRAWTSQDPPFYYLEKFQTFWFRQWIADSSVTRAILSEIQHFKEHGKLPSVYRHAEEYIIMSHFHCLDRLWD